MEMSEEFLTGEAEADPVDQGSKHAERERRMRELAAREKAKPEQVKALNEDGVLAWPTETCVRCEEDIEEGRLELGYIRCIKCQTLKERKEKGL